MTVGNARCLSTVIAGQKASTGPRKARPDDRLRAVFAPEDPAIHEAEQQSLQ
jgi:hypothetical protein